MKKLPPEELRRLNSMCYFIEQTRKYNIEPKVIFDIGAYNAAHTLELAQEFNVPLLNAYAFEPHPGMIYHCKNRKVNVLEMAISNFDGIVDFNAIDLTQSCHHGCSSLYPINRPHNTIKVPVHRIDTLIRKCDVPIPDMVKIDVEGKSYEVLEGFGFYLEQVKILHVETETIDFYKSNQKTKDDIVKFMEAKNFEVVHELFIPEFQYDLIFVNRNVL